MFKTYKRTDGKSKVELLYKKYEESDRKSTLGRDKLYEMINEEFSRYSKYLPLTPLDIEIFMNNIGEVEKLLSNGYDINEVNEIGFSPLCAAVMLNNYDIAKYLIENGANTKGIENFIPLMICAECKNDKIMELLLENGVDANQLDKNGWSALQHLFLIGGIPGLNSHAWNNHIPFSFYKSNHQKNQLNCVNILNDAGIDINHTTKIDYKLNIKGEKIPIEISALTLALNAPSIPSQETIKRLIDLGIEPKAYELKPSDIYSYQDDFNFINDIKDLDISIWSQAIVEYLEYLRYLRVLKKFNIEMYTNDLDDGYKRAKLIKSLKK